MGQDVNKDCVKVSGTATLSCAKCQKEFDLEIPTVIVGSKDLDFLKSFFDHSAFLIKCPHCGCERFSVYQFIFYDEVDNCVYYIIPDEKMLCFEATRIMLDEILSDYVKSTDIHFQNSLRVAKKYYVPMKTFYSALYGGEKGYTQGSLHITPQPTIEINKKFEFVGETINYNISKNNLLLVENNLPEHLEALVYYICETTKRFGFPLQTNKIEEERKVVTTEGVPEILIILGSNVVLPIVLGVAANFISDWLKKSKEAKKNKANEEFIKFVFKVNDTDKAYVFAGRMGDLVKTFEEISVETISSLKLNGVSHIATTVGDVISDCFADRLLTFQEASDYYRRKFNRNSSVEYNLYQETNDYVFKTTRASAVAAKLMSSGEYKSALSALEPVIFNVQPPETPTNAILYNYAQCLFQLGRKDEAINVFTQIIQQYLQLPTIDDMEYFKTGCTTREDIDNVSSEALKKVKSARGETFSHLPNILDIQSQRVNMEVERLIKDKDKNWIKRFFSKIFKQSKKIDD